MRFFKSNNIENSLCYVDMFDYYFLQESLMKIEQQKMEKEMKQQAIENVSFYCKKVTCGPFLSLRVKRKFRFVLQERERKRQQQVMDKVGEKEKRKRELNLMKAYEAQRRAEVKLVSDLLSEPII